MKGRDKPTCKNTNIPPKSQATALTPFFTKTPEHIPATAPKDSSNNDTEDCGGDRYS